MKFTILGRIAGVLALTIGLAGCIDMTAEVEVLSETTGKATTTTTMGAEFYPMIKSMGAEGSDTKSDFCKEAGATLVENADNSATCTVIVEGNFDQLKTDGPTEDASFTVVSPGVVRVAFKTEDMAGEVTKDQDAETAAMMKTYFEGHNATIRVKGREVLETNMTLSEDKTSAEIVIPFVELMDGTLTLPPELFAVVKTN